MDAGYCLELPETACLQAGCLRECFDAAGIALECHGAGDAGGDEGDR